MRKGLLLALAMAVMAALMVVPVGASSPLVKDLPQLVMSDDEQGGGKFLMMFPNAYGANCFLFGPDGLPGTNDDEDVVAWNNDWQDGYGTETRYVWLGEDNAPGAKATEIVAMKATGQYQTKLIRTEPQWAALKGGSMATLPGDSITTNTANEPAYFSLTLINNDYGVGNAALINPRGIASANATAAGVAQPAAGPWTAPAGANIGPTDLILLTAITSATAGYKTDWNWFSVYSLINDLDRTSQTWQNSVSHVMSSNAEGWIYAAGSGTGVVAASQSSNASGIGFNVTTIPTNNDTVFGAWFEPEFNVVPGDASTSGSIYRIVGTLQGNAVSAEACPSYRLVYMNQGFSHLGGVAVQTKSTDAGSIAAPYTGNAAAARLYFRTAYKMSGMEDSGIQATYKPGGVGSGADYRKYTLRFDLSLDKNMGATDAGTIYLSSFLVQSALRSDPRFDDVNNIVKGNWGAGGTTFVGNWTTTAFAPGYTTGTVRVIAAGNCDLGLGGTSGARGLTLQPQGMISGVDWATKKLVRMAWSAQSMQNVNLTPQVQAKAFIYDLATGVRGLMWGDFYGGGVYGKPPASGNLDPRTKIAPACPTQAGNAVESYFFMHNNDATLGGFFFPQFSVLENGGYGPGSAWEYPSGTVRFTSIKIVDMGLD